VTKLHTATDKHVHVRRYQEGINTNDIQKQQQVIDFQDWSPPPKKNFDRLLHGVTVRLATGLTNSDRSDRCGRTWYAPDM